MNSAWFQCVTNFKVHQSSYVLVPCWSSEPHRVVWYPSMHSCSWFTRPRTCASRHFATVSATMCHFRQLNQDALTRAPYIVFHLHHGLLHLHDGMHHLLHDRHICIMEVIPKWPCYCSYSTSVIFRVTSRMPDDAVTMCSLCLSLAVLFPIGSPLRHFLLK